MLKRVLVVGGGVGGMTAAVALRRQNIAVDLVEIDPQWKIYGAGITITAPTLRACKRLGILPEIKREGATWDHGELYSEDGKQAGRVQWPKFDPDEPSAGGIMRPALHRLLSSLTRAEGVAVRLGMTVASLRPSGETVSAEFSDGSRADYDLVIGADGIYSKVRQLVFPEAPKPAFTGQSVYRIVCERPADIRGSRFYPRGDSLLGCSLVSDTHMYLFVLLPMPGNPRVASEQQPRHLYEVMGRWDDCVHDIRARVQESPLRETINYRPLEALLLPAPWHRGRVLLIGDAAHATTPHMASGAGMAIEDGLVLAEELARGGALADALQRFSARRFPRCQTVVENSVRIGALEMSGGSAEEHNRLVHDTIDLLIREP